VCQKTQIKMTSRLRQEQRLSRHKQAYLLHVKTEWFTFGATAGTPHFYGFYIVLG
jgi:hypothetical protein